MTEAYLIKGSDVKEVGRCYRILVAIARAADMEQPACEEEKAAIQFLIDVRYHHYFIPVGLGSGRSDLLHELHAFSH